MERKDHNLLGSTGQDVGRTLEEFVDHTPRDILRIPLVFCGTAVAA